MKTKILFILSIIMFALSCGKDIKDSIATTLTNTDGNVTVTVINGSPFRITRGTVADDADIALRDALCVSEFGEGWSVGTMVEYAKYFQGVTVTPSFSVGVYEGYCSSSGGCICPVLSTSDKQMFCIRS